MVSQDEHKDPTEFLQLKQKCVENLEPFQMLSPPTEISRQILLQDIIDVWSLPQDTQIFNVCH
uniref:Uncharacterized protein n=1 Tax=Arundo donax TaxID=35708 RepID=A0A0A8XYX2_ARUDO